MLKGGGATPTMSGKIVVRQLAKYFPDYEENSFVLAAGSFGKVLSVRDADRGCRIALKVPRSWRQGNGLDSSLTMQEARHLKLAASAHVIPLLGVFRGPGQSLSLAMTCADADLAAFLSKRGALPESMAWHLLPQICRGVAHVHSVGLAHRDLKLGNLLLRFESEPAARAHVFVSGLGAACTAPPAKFREVATDQILASQHGRQRFLWPASKMRCTIPYAAPEVFDGQAGCASDAWAIGAIAYEFVAGRRLIAATERTLVVHELKQVPERVAALPRQGDDALLAQEPTSQSHRLHPSCALRLLPFPLPEGSPKLLTPFPPVSLPPLLPALPPPLRPSTSVRRP